MKHTYIFIFLLTFSFFQSNAQDDDVWTLERCITYAIENNLDIKRQVLQSQLSRKDYQQSQYNLLPSLNLGFNHELSSGRSLNTEEYIWENTEKQQGAAGITSDLTLFTGLRQYNNIRYNKFRFLSSQEDLEALKNEMTLALVAYYLNILFADELLEVARSQYETTLLQVEKNKKLVEIGNAAKSELLEIQAQASTERLQVTMAENSKKMAILELTQLLDLDEVGSFTVFKPEILKVEAAELAGEMNEIYATAVRIMPEVKSAEFMVMAQERLVRINQGSRMPTLSLSGLYYSRYLNGAYDQANMTYDYPYIDQFVDNRYAQLSVSINFPLFSRLNTQTNIAKSKLMLQDYQLQLDQTKQTLYKSIQQYHADAVAALDKYLSAQEAVVSNEEAFNYTQQKFDVGLVNSVDFNVAKNNLTKAKSDLAQAKYEYIFKIKILDFYTGKPLQL